MMRKIFYPPGASMQARDFLEKYVYGIFWQWWATTSIGNQAYKGLIEEALLMIYAHEWKLMSWMVRSEAVINPDCNMLKFYTQYPIVGDPTFRLGTKEEVEKISAQCVQCDTECEESDCSCTVNVSNLCCCDDFNVIKDMVKVWPASILTDKQYKISGWDFAGGLFGKKVEAKLCNTCSTCLSQGGGIFISYFAWYNPVDSLTAEIPLPNAYLPVLAFFMASIAISRLQNYRVGDDQFFDNKAQLLLKNISKLDRNIPRAMIAANGKDFYSWL